VDGSAIAEGLSARLGGIGVEHGGEEDRAALRVEVEDLGRVRRQAETVLLGPKADLVGAALEDGDIERVDADLEDLLGRSRSRGGGYCRAVTQGMVSTASRTWSADAISM